MKQEFSIHTCMEHANLDKNCSFCNICVRLNDATLRYNQIKIKDIGDELKKMLSIKHLADGIEQALLVVKKYKS